MLVRRAKEADALAIHESHMRSIREICGPDYTAEEITAWGGRAYDAEMRLRGIREDRIWAPEAVGHGLGKRILESLLADALDWRAHSVHLESTLTSVSFYESQGFRRVG